MVEQGKGATSSVTACSILSLTISNNLQQSLLFYTGCAHRYPV